MHPANIGSAARVTVLSEAGSPVVSPLSEHHPAVSSPTKQQTRRASYTGPARSSGTAGTGASPVTNRLLPFVVLLFIGSGCAALIYEIVWFQLLSWSSARPRCRSACCSARSWAACASAASPLPLRVAPPASAARLRVARAGHRRLRTARACGDAVRRRLLLRDRAARHRGPAGSRPLLRALPAAADAADGRDAAGDRALGRDDARRRRRGWASSTAATSPAPSSAACSPASICCACTTWRWRRTSPSRST